MHLLNLGKLDGFILSVSCDCGAGMDIWGTLALSLLFSAILCAMMNSAFLASRLLLSVSSF